MSTPPNHFWTLEDVAEARRRIRAPATVMGLLRPMRAAFGRRMLRSIGTFFLLGLSLPVVYWIATERVPPRALIAWGLFPGLLCVVVCILAIASLVVVPLLTVSRTLREVERRLRRGERIPRTD